MVCWACWTRERGLWSWKINQTWSIYIDEFREIVSSTPNGHKDFVILFFFVVVGFISMITQTYSGSAVNPLPFTMELGNFVSLMKKVHFSRFRFSPNLRRAWKVVQAHLYTLHGINQIVVNVGRYVSARRDSGQGFCYAGDVRPKAWHMYRWHQFFHANAALWRSSSPITICQ